MGIILTLLVFLGLGYVFRDTFDSAEGCLTTIGAFVLLYFLINYFLT
tara:strand:+ start:850 stop:990 length:141 start_codon:yes stop_codon:yes gene_type:complete